MRAGFDQSPVNPLPWVVLLLVLPVVAMELVVSAGGTGLVGGQNGVGWRIDAIQRFSFAPGVADWMREGHHYMPETVMRFVTYPFVHGNFTHALFVVVFLLALGKMVAEIYSALAVLAIFFGATLAGAIAYWALPGVEAPLFGGYPPVYGLIGAFTYILWVRLGLEHANRARAFSLIGFLLAAQLVFGLIFGSGWDWVAEIAGFATGFLLSFVVSPGGFSRVVQMIRQR